MQFVQVDSDGRPEPLDDEPDDEPLDLELPGLCFGTGRVSSCTSGNNATRLARDIGPFSPTTSFRSTARICRGGCFSVKSAYLGQPYGEYEIDESSGRSSSPSSRFSRTKKRGVAWRGCEVPRVACLMQQIGRLFLRGQRRSGHRKASCSTGS